MQPNLPSDFASRNAIDCVPPGCQICIIIDQPEVATVHRITVPDILLGKGQLPYTNRNAWFDIQSDCSDLRRTLAHLEQST